MLTQNIDFMANPVFESAVFTSGDFREDAMTVSGAIEKTFILALLCIAAGWFSWNHPAAPMMAPISLIVGFIVAMIICFKPTWAPTLAPLYAVLEGLFLGAVSSFFEKEMQGIVVQTVELTGGVFLAMLAAFQMRLIQPTRRFYSFVIGATTSVVFIYVAHLIARVFFGTTFSFITGNGNLAIAFSVVICLIAAFNLILDFDIIEKGAETGAPKHMEWYSAFGLLVTIVWLYLEVLRLLSKLRSR